ncbi:MAG: alanine--tRNA ligase [Candidatus Chisholmbacteria bacterium]|nr:alanine--tRNA ligase [Candidatus Chisholmbacteria bacterium]
MKADDIRQKYLNFFANRGHKIIPSSSLVPENDPTTLFTGSGMQPMLPYLLGEKHPLGNRIADSQKCFRAEDIEEVGDNRHTTFFEMLGNWSLGSYWKKEQLGWFFEFLTEVLNINPQSLYVTVFSGDPQNKIPRDGESVEIWQKLFSQKNIAASTVELVTEKQGYKHGMQDGRIFYYEAKKNWWSRSGVPQNMPSGEPGGPDSEVFFLFDEVKHDPKYGPHCHPNCNCGRFLEIGNSVFMAYQKQTDGSFKELPQQNVDFGGGLERLAAVTNHNPDVFQTDLFLPLLDKLETAADVSYQKEAPSLRRISDHFKCAVMMAADGVIPSNKDQGSVMRRLIRKAMISMRKISLNYKDTTLIGELVQATATIYKHAYPQVLQQQKHIGDVMAQESQQFSTALDRGIKKLESLKEVDGKVAFDLYQSYGLPLEMTEELLAQMGQRVDRHTFTEEFKKHQAISRSGASKKFAGGLADHSAKVIRLHTATHLLHQALREVLGGEVRQEGSNITAARLRFDFSHHQSLSEDEIKKVELLVNQKVKENLPVHKTIASQDEALKSGALAFFKEKYPDKVSVYTIGKDPKTDWWSKELCGGPHVASTGKIGPVKIIKQQSVGGGIRRLYAELTD